MRIALQSQILYSIMCVWGGNAIFLSGYNRDHLITQNEFLENGATCVNVCGSKEALHNVNEWEDYVTEISQIVDIEGPKTEDYAKDITISYNHMQNMGRYEKQTEGVNLFLTESILVAHNTIHGSPRSGLNVCDGAWGGHVFEFNDVFDCVKETEDHGPWNAWGRDRFYSIGGYNHSGSDGAIKRPYAFHEAWKTTNIRNNRFHYSEEREFGIDLDDGASNYEIYNNLILNTSVKLREGFNRKVYNNIMVNRGPDFHVWYSDYRDEVTSDIIVGNTAYSPIGVGSGAASTNSAVIDNNLFFNSGNDVNVVTDNWPNVDLNSVTANPRFVDPENLDYTVAEGSPALALGFVDFPMDQFGKPGAPEPEAVEFIDEPPAGSDGDPFLGGSIASIYSVAVQSSLGAADMNGVHFELLPEASVAATQGFHVRDAILEVNGVRLTTKDSFYESYNKIMPGDEIDAIILRDQEEHPFSFFKPIEQGDLNDTAGVVYTGAWTKEIAETSIGGDLHVTNTLGDSFEVEFYGTGITLKAFTSSESGQVDIYIDDVFGSTVSLFSNTEEIRQVVYSIDELAPPGFHTLRLVNKEAKSVAFDAYSVEYLPLYDGELNVETSGSSTAPVVSSTDLAQLYYLSSSATGDDEVAEQHAELFNGQVGTSGDNAGELGVVRIDSDNTFTINFDISENYRGYDIMGINSYFGWNTGAGGRSNQGYAIRFQLVDNTIFTIPGEHWNPNSPTFYWTIVSFTATTEGEPIIGGVKSITFDITHNAIPGSIVIGREFDIIGTPTDLPKGFEGWIEGYDLDDKSEMGDPDNDGMSRLLEYVLGGDPVVSDPGISPYVEVDESEGEYVFRFARRIGTENYTTQIFEYGSDLIGWTQVNITAPSGPEVTLGDETAGLQSVWVTVEKTSELDSNVYGRLRVE
ncbi:hypothetical protein MLD52_01445 [Puniceicoccaceae bacterium K14]|nr:hypothetical protein [Puniceicoccaceae bacterium K14]